jgi:hypothetical protein
MRIYHTECREQRGYQHPWVTACICGYPPSSISGPKFDSEPEQGADTAHYWKPAFMTRALSLSPPFHPNLWCELQPTPGYAALPMNHAEPSNILGIQREKYRTSSANRDSRLSRIRNFSRPCFQLASTPHQRAVSTYMQASWIFPYLVLRLIAGWALYPETLDACRSCNFQ